MKVKSTTEKKRIFFFSFVFFVVFSKINLFCFYVRTNNKKQKEGIKNNIEPFSLLQNSKKFTAQKEKTNIQILSRLKNKILEFFFCFCVFLLSEISIANGN